LFRVSITRTRIINFKKGARFTYGWERNLPKSIKMEMRMLVCTVTRSRRELLHVRWAEIVFNS
jgi:hypothetical protein